jgi:hypothetical protein
MKAFRVVLAALGALVLVSAVADLGRPEAAARAGMDSNRDAVARWFAAY